MNVRSRRASRPNLERVECRELLSSTALAGFPSRPSVSAIGALTHRTLSASASETGNTRIAGNALSGNNQSPLLGNGATLRELGRQSFRAGFNGRYYTGPGRFMDQGTTDFYRGLGGSNFFLHGDFDMAVITPVDPSAPFLGEAVLNDKNANTNATLGLILTGDRSSVDSLGRPTHLTFTGDPNIYGGTFLVAGSEGTIDIKYGTGANHPISVKFSGLVYTTGLTSPLINQDLYTRQGRPLRFRG